ncbi:MAG: type II toxin-antitoxin system VapC family toxin [Terracidiphilus sp.]
MTTSIDSNIIVALWRQDDPLNGIAATMLNQARKQGGLAISAPVYAELMGDPRRTESELNEFLQDTGILIEWTLDERAWREAGRAYQGYVARRRTEAGSYPRRILTDFLIGAHALVRSHSLLTFDLRLFAAAFPALSIISE